MCSLSVLCVAWVVATAPCMSGNPVNNSTCNRACLWAIEYCDPVMGDCHPCEEQCRFLDQQDECKEKCPKYYESQQAVAQYEASEAHQARQEAQQAWQEVQEEAQRAWQAWQAQTSTNKSQQPDENDPSDQKKYIDSVTPLYVVLTAILIAVIIFICYGICRDTHRGPLFNTKHQGEISHVHVVQGTFNDIMKKLVVDHDVKNKDACNV